MSIKINVNAHFEVLKGYNRAQVKVGQYLDKQATQNLSQAFLRKLSTKFNPSFIHLLEKQFMQGYQRLFITIGTIEFEVTRFFNVFSLFHSILCFFLYITNTPFWHIVFMRMFFFFFFILQYPHPKLNWLQIPTATPNLIFGNILQCLTQKNNMG